MQGSRITVAVGEHDVAVSRGSTIVTARILGRDLQQDGESLWLDRLVHAPMETELGAWAVSGAVVSVLTRRIGTEL